MTAKILREAAALMRERAELPYVKGAWAASGGYVRRSSKSPRIGYPAHAEATCVLYDDADAKITNEAIAEYVASWHPVVALAVAKAMDAVAHAWEIADESADGWVYDADDNHYRFEETVDGGWLAVALAYLGEEA